MEVGLIARRTTPFVAELATGSISAADARAEDTSKQRRLVFHRDRRAPRVGAQTAAVIFARRQRRAVVLEKEAQEEAYEERLRQANQADGEALARVGSSRSSGELAARARRGARRVRCATPRAAPSHRPPADGLSDVSTRIPNREHHARRMRRSSSPPKGDGTRDARRQHLPGDPRSERISAGTTGTAGTSLSPRRGRARPVHRYTPPVSSAAGGSSPRARSERKDLSDMRRPVRQDRHFLREGRHGARPLELIDRGPSPLVRRLVTDKSLVASPDSHIRPTPAPHRRPARARAKRVGGVGRASRAGSESGGVVRRDAGEHRRIVYPRLLDRVRDAALSLWGAPPRRGGTVSSLRLRRRTSAFTITITVPNRLRLVKYRKPSRRNGATERLALRTLRATCATIFIMVRTEPR